MSDLKRIEEMHNCESCYWGDHAKKLARALDEAVQSMNGVGTTGGRLVNEWGRMERSALSAKRVLREVAGEKL